MAPLPVRRTFRYALIHKTRKATSSTKNGTPMKGARRSLVAASMKPKWRASLLMALAPFQGIDVGIDRKSPVSWAVHERHGSFPFTGVLHEVAYQPGAPAPDHPDNFLDLLVDWGRSFE